MRHRIPDAKAQAEVQVALTPISSSTILGLFGGSANFKWHNSTATLGIGVDTNIAPSEDPTVDIFRSVGSAISHAVADDSILSGTNPYFLVRYAGFTGSHWFRATSITSLIHLDGGRFPTTAASTPTAEH